MPGPEPVSAEALLEYGLYSVQIEQWLAAIPSFAKAEPPPPPRRLRLVLLGSTGAHLLLLSLIAVPGPHDRSARGSHEAWVETPASIELVSPTFEVPQKSPNRGPRESLMDHEMSRPVFPLFSPTTVPRGIAPGGFFAAGGENTNPGLPLGSLAPMSPQGTGGSYVAAMGDVIRPSEGTPLPFDVIPPTNSSSPAGRHRPDSAWIIVGNSRVPGGGAREGLGLPTAPPGVGSHIELISDPHGLELGPYLGQMLGALRRNWGHALLRTHESGSAGEAWVEFTVLSSGEISEASVARSTLSSSLTRLTIYGVRASSPMPPFRALEGTSLRLRVVFRYTPPAQ
jgi:hypothetical protein